MPATPTITAFESSPDRGKGLARDMRVRWALEEVGRPYDVRLLSFDAMKEPAHLALQPFGQIPTYEDGDLAIFDSGAIVLHIADHHAGLLPDDANARARAIAWMFAAVTTMEPTIVDRETASLLERHETWHQQRLAVVEDRIRNRLGALSARLGEADWLDGGVQRRRPPDGVGAATIEELGHSGGVPEPRGLCRPRRGPPRLQARLRRPAGGIHRQPADPLKDERTRHGHPEEHDLPLVRQRRRGRGPLLRHGLPRQRR